MSRLTQERINQVIQGLQGTCADMAGMFDEIAEFYEFGFEFDDLNRAEEMEFCTALDNALFLCSVCGWWCEAGDWVTPDEPGYNANEETCSQCGEEE